MDTVAARQQMVDQQIRTWEVLDPRVLEVFATVPREAFVPPEYRDLAFADAEIPIGYGQSMLAPKLQGRILQALAVTAKESVLEVGSGTGYLSACLALLSSSTHSVDIHPELTKAAAVNVRTVPSASVKFETRDACSGDSHRLWTIDAGAEAAGPHFAGPGSDREGKRARSRQRHRLSVGLPGTAFFLDTQHRHSS